MNVPTSFCRRLVTCAAFLLLADAALAQQPRNLYELSGGMDIQTSPERFKEFWSTGGGADFTFNRYLSERLAMTFGVTFNRFTIETELVEQFVAGELPDSLQFLADLLAVDDGDVTVAAARVGLSRDFQMKASSFEDTNEGRILFHVRTALGIAYNAITDLELALLEGSTTVEGASNIGFTVEGGGGFRFFLTNTLGLSLETVVVANFVEGETLLYLPIRFGVFVTT